MDIIRIFVLMNIKVTIKNVYGNNLIYPVCKSAECFACLIKKKTFTMVDLMYIKELGYTINYI